MDNVKLVLIGLLLASNANAAIFDMGEHSGIIRDSNGNFSQVSSNGSVRSLTSNTQLSIVEKVNFQTSKGIFEAEITRNALVDVGRIGKTVRGLAVAGGPVGLTISAVSLVCELTDICNQAGQWIMGADPAIEGFPATTPKYSWGGYGGQYPSPQAACNGAVKAHYIGIYSADPVPYNGQEDYYDCQYKSQTGTPISGFTSRSPLCADHYVLTGSECVLQGNSQAHAPTSSDWDSKESILNDARFVPELDAKGSPIPVQVPTIGTPKTVQVGKETTTLKDGSGNTTGTEETTTEAKLESPTSQENPNNLPSLIKITETTTKNTYNINNQLTGSTSTVSSGEQQPQQQSFTIELDNVEKQPLEERAVPMPLVMDSWGSGSCPADRQVNYHYGSLNLTFQPACDFATGLQPIVIILAGFIAMYIISGAMKND